jgi:hypothetical protein
MLFPEKKRFTFKGWIPSIQTNYLHINLIYLVMGKVEKKVLVEFLS